MSAPRRTCGSSASTTELASSASRSTSVLRSAHACTLLASHHTLLCPHSVKKGRKTNVTLKLLYVKELDVTLVHALVELIAIKHQELPPSDFTPHHHPGPSLHLHHHHHHPRSPPLPPHPLLTPSPHTDPQAMRIEAPVNPKDEPQLALWQQAAFVIEGSLAVRTREATPPPPPPAAPSSSGACRARTHTPCPALTLRPR